MNQQKSKFIPTPDKKMKAAQIAYNITMDQLKRYMADEIENQRKVKIVTTETGRKLFNEAMIKEGEKIHNTAWVTYNIKKKTRRKQINKARNRFMPLLKSEEEKAYWDREVENHKKIQSARWMTPTT